MQKLTFEEAKKIAEYKGLMPAKVHNQDGVYFTNGMNPRRHLRVISWSEFQEHLESHGLAVYNWKGFLKVMKDE